MHRFFVEPVQFQAEKPVIRGQDYQHMVRVLRLGPGDEVHLLDGTGRAAMARIESVGRQEAVLVRLEEYTPVGEPPVRVTLVQGLAKGEKMDMVIQKSTELGVSEIIPLVCRRSVVRLEGDRAGDRRDRWQKVAAGAARQCRRAIIPLVRPPRGLGEVLAAIPPGAFSFLPWEEEGENPLGKVLPASRPDRVFIFIGPEGGFDPSEVEEARRRGVAAVTLGPRILRTETAGLACLSIVLHRWGDLG